MFTSFYDCRDNHNSKPVIQLRKDSKYYEEITALLNKDHLPSQQPTMEVSVCWMQLQVSANYGFILTPSAPKLIYSQLWQQLFC